MYYNYNNVTYLFILKYLCTKVINKSYVYENLLNTEKYLVNFM